jgi:phosphoglycerate dehydrogenase-like enzyme
MAELAVHILHEPEPSDLGVLRSELDPGISFTVGPDLPDPAAFEVLVAGRPTREQLEASPALRMLVIPYAGVPKETAVLLADYPDVVAHNLHHNSPASTEMAIGLLLAACKMILPMDAALREGRWSGRGQDNPAVLLTGKTALVLGYGSIGRKVSRVLRAFGMEVLAVRRTTGDAEDEDGVSVHPQEALPDLLPRATVLAVCVPLTLETKGMIGRDELALLPEGAVLVNVARGPVVDEEALYEALRSGRLHSAGIDVWYVYPGRAGDPNDTKPSRFPFEELPNVVMSPHRGGWLHEVEACDTWRAS